MNYMYCPNCGTEISSDMGFCSKCGTNLNENNLNQSYKNPQYVIPMKSAGIAAVLSFLFTGLGQIYLGKIGRGLLLICGGIVIGSCNIIALFAGAAFDSSGNVVSFGVIGPVVLIALAIIAIIYWVWQIYDAYKLANEYNEYLRQTGREPW